MPRSSIKDEEVYRAVRREGASKEKAARIANASARRGRSAVGRKGGKAERYDDMTKRELYERAKELGIEGRSRMSRAELVQALRR